MGTFPQTPSLISSTESPSPGRRTATRWLGFTGLVLRRTCAETEATEAPPGAGSDIPECQLEVHQVPGAAWRGGRNPRKSRHWYCSPVSGFGR